MADPTPIVEKKDSSTLNKSLNTKLQNLPVIGQTKEGQQFSKTAQAYGDRAAEATGEVERHKIEQQSRLLGAQAGVQKDYAQVQRGLYTEAENKELEYPRPEFHPTKENAESLGQLFSMVATMGIMLGGGGKMASQNALGAMTGMLKGWQQGRKDLYERELKEFDKEYKRISDIRTDIQNRLQKSLQLASTDKEAASLEAQQAAAIAGGDSMVKALVNQGKTQQALELIKQASTIDQQVIQRQQSAAQHAQSMAMQQQRLNFEKQKYTDTQNAPKPLEQYFPGLVFDPKDKKATQDKRDAINNGALSLATAQDLINYAKQHPDALGRQGQINQNVERYIKSFQDGTDLPTDGQPNLVFAKRYAAYLVSYERALAGGNKSMTVAFQKRFNELMSQNQFNAGGFEQLMRQQMQEIAEGVSARDPAITGRGLYDYGLDIKKRGELSFENAASEIPKTTTTKPKNAPPDAKQADDGFWYSKDSKTGKYIKWSD